MYYKKLNILLLVFIISGFAAPVPTVNNSIERSEDDKTHLYLKGIEVLKNKDTVSAVTLFKESIRKFDDASSHFQLANIYLKQNTYRSRNQAFENFEKAAQIEPGNLEYRYGYALIMKDFAKRSAESEFKKIINIDSTFVDAWLNLGEIKDEDFTEYNNSVRKMNEDIFGSLQEFANEDFFEAEKYYLTALKYDSTNYRANFKLSLLYEKAGSPDKSIYYLNKIINAKKDNKDIHLCLGLMLYKTRKLEECYGEYQKALSLMDEEEKTDFTFNSVKCLIEPAFSDYINTTSDYELKQFIEVYWKVYDPLYLTDYNERLLEHYSRVAFADLHFSIPRMKRAGWKTNRGEAVLRFGEPLNFTRIRPSMESNGVSLKTEVWNYPFMTLGFTDLASSGNYLFSAPDVSNSKTHTQFSGDTHFFMENLKNLNHSFYDPKFEGPVFEAPYSIAQFKSKDKRNNTDIYINYVLEQPDSLFMNEDISVIKYNTGIFFFNKNHEEVFRKISSFETGKNENGKNIKSTNVTERPDSGMLSFEIMRSLDKGVSVNRSSLKIKKFSEVALGISDVFIANYAGEDSSDIFPMKRDNVKIIPAVKNEFGAGDPLFIYYEVYNLKKGGDGLTDFEQKISINKIEDKNSTGLISAVNSVLYFAGIKKKEEVTLGSNYRTKEVNPQIYLQIDLGQYPVGEYEITIAINDNILKKNVSASSIINWKGK